MVQNEATAWRWPLARASCPAGKKMVGGGGRCLALSPEGWTWLWGSSPENNNTWRVTCDSPKDQNVQAIAFVFCQ